MRWMLVLALQLCLSVSTASCAEGEPLRVAVAANFKPALEMLAREFERQSGISLRVSAGSTGTLYAQIRHGAPFDVFMAADAERPRRLEEEMRIIPGTRRSYALGRLALWIPEAEEVSLLHLLEVDFPLAIANPRLAPYGAAAMDVIQAGMPVMPQLIRGNNVAQVTSFIATGNARGGFAPLSHMLALAVDPKTYWPVPGELHRVIDQQVVALRGAPGSYADWLAFLGSGMARRLIAAAGYDHPPDA